MSLIEFIGFVISLAALIFLFFRKVSEERYRREHPKEFEEQEKQKEQAMKEWLKKMNIEVDEDEEEEEEEEEEIPIPKPQPKKMINKQPPPPLPSKAFKRYANDSVYEVSRLESSSRGNTLIKGLKSRRDMIIYKELLSKPLAIRNHTEDPL